MQPAGRRSPSSSELLGVGAMVAGALLVPLVAGLLLDGVLRTGPVLTLVGLGLGIVAAAATMFVRFRHYL